MHRQEAGGRDRDRRNQGGRDRGRGRDRGWGAAGGGYLLGVAGALELLEVFLGGLEKLGGRLVL